MTREHCCLFVDATNVLVQARQTAAAREGWYAARLIRVEFGNLVSLAIAGRRVVRAACVGSNFGRMDDLWGYMRRQGVAVELLERGRETGKEQGVDAALQIHMLRVALDLEPGVAVLVTGDGSGYERGVGFHADLERMAQQGWGVELLSWDESCGDRFRDWVRDVGAYVSLDDYYDSVTFLEDGRRPKPLNLTGRPLARPLTRAQRSVLRTIRRKLVGKEESCTET